VLGLAIGAGVFEGSLLRASRYGVALAMLGVAVSVLLVYSALAPLLLRLRMKADGTLHLPHSQSGI